MRVEPEPEPAPESEPRSRGVASTGQYPEKTDTASECAAAW